MMDYSNYNGARELQMLSAQHKHLPGLTLYSERDLEIGLEKPSKGLGPVRYTSLLFPTCATDCNPVTNNNKGILHVTCVFHFVAGHFGTLIEHRYVVE